jgi:hypothetical protein
MHNAPEAPAVGFASVADVMVAALGIACIDPEAPDELAAAVLFSLLGLQNLAESYAETILAYASARPAAFIAAAEMHWMDGRRHQDRGRWLHWLLFQRRDHERVRPSLDAAIQRWLSFWCLDPDRIPHHGLSPQEVEKEKAHYVASRETRSPMASTREAEPQRYAPRAGSLDHPRRAAMAMPATSRSNDLATAREISTKI